MVEEREERRQAKLEALRAAVQEGLESGPTEVIDPSELVKRLKAHGRDSLKASGRRG